METTPEMEKHLQANMNISRKDIMLANFLGGLAWGFGTVVGATVVVAIIGSILKAIGVFDALGILIGQSVDLGQGRPIPPVAR